MAASACPQRRPTEVAQSSQFENNNRKEELIDRVIKAKEGGNEIEERETREKKVRETRAAEKLPVHKL